MNITPEQVKQITTQLAAVETKTDLAALLSEAQNILHGKTCKPITATAFAYHMNPYMNKNRYRNFTIKKKSGGARVIYAPTNDLKAILRALNLILQCMYTPARVVTGFVPGRSIVDNAKCHIGHRYVYNIDVKDFFHSFDRNRVKLAFMYAPFNLRDKREPLAFFLASLCTQAFRFPGEVVKAILVQGSPTSPTLTNIICATLDRRLTGLARRFGVTYSRYADDITFSSEHCPYNREDFQRELLRIIEGQGLTLNPDKTRLQNLAHRQEVTGLIVNEKVNVRRRYVKQLRMYLYYLEKYGFYKAEAIFLRDYLADRKHNVKGNPQMLNVLGGKLDFLRMVKGQEDSTYISLLQRFQRFDFRPTKISKTLDAWEMGGIKEGMKIYYGQDKEK
ncbi:hypothetical protein LEM8419_00349 [Neolewinella maritima]|uniref:RNA-directed DNA polymerase n=1 Tax=Neolewinella maritima TaxID=1383882 RepID=A0ABM9AX76_9BACT|nr:reverse transcriptase family protein [Neolewinella maritima]CAH0999054.1 hypothetical protein LEM8419_00349 [Neolewinella maritima]